MKTHTQKLASAIIMLLVAVNVQARPIALPDPATGSSQSGSFSINAEDQITVTGNPVSLTTSLPANGDVASGTARFMSGSLHYNDGSATVDGRMARVTFGSQINNGQVTYLIKGLVYGTLTQAGKTVDVNGDFAVTTKPAPEGTELTQAQVDSSDLLLTIRSNINNTQAQ
ncbi:hypothetical protein [Crenothrix sp.]|uniref:hypothetical protein n=1 Tax=Crenothrix sp. TaxID=3100433 RepID=UPI00374DD997